VSAPEQRLRAWCTTVAVCVLTATWWGFTALLARDVQTLSIQLTNACVALGLIAIFVSGWTIAFAWSRSARRRVAFRAIATTLLLFVLVLILEIPAAVAIVDYSEVWSRLTGEWEGPTTSFINDWDVGFRHPPHSKWAGQPRSDMAVYWNLPIRRAAPMSFTTDARGFRNAFDRDSAEIALLGDSYIEGAYVSDDETCAAVAERKSGLQLTNLGLAGYGTLQELEVLIRYAVPLRPKLVAWFFFEGNDLYNDTDFEGCLPLLREHRPYSTSRWNWSWHDFCNRSLTCTIFRFSRRVLDPVVPNSVETSGTFRDKHGVLHRMYFNSYGELEYGDYEKKCFERTKAAFRRGRDVCDQNGIRLVLVYIPMKFRVYGELCKFPPASPCVDWHPWNLVDYFRQFCDDESISWVDLTPLMHSAAMRGEVLYVPEDSHWNAEGHAFVADRILEQWNRYFGLAP
jgi:SGNH hydrolase-like domain, acetyltransferase AlgX